MFNKKYRIFITAAFLLLIAVVTSIKHADAIKIVLIDFLIDGNSIEVEKVLKACPVKDFPFKNITKLPSHWKAVEERGIDSAVGYFESDKKGLKINYDIGSGVFVEYKRTYERERVATWHQIFFYDSDMIFCLRFEKMVFISIVEKKNYLKWAKQYYGNSLYGAVTYRTAAMMSTRVPGNSFYTEFKTEEDLEYIIELVARHWRKLFENRKRLEFKTRIPVKK
jgi:hypothetical protein